MTATNVNTIWGHQFVDALTAAGVDAACLTPGSRSTPLTVAFTEQPDVQIFSHLDERSSAFFALGRGKRLAEPTPLVCTSGTATAEFHPAVLEADQARVPMLVLTADRPPELRDSGANQTINQTDLYGGAVRWSRTLPEPALDERKIRDLRTTASRAVAKATSPPQGPVHLNFPFRKPLDPMTADGASAERLAQFTDSSPDRHLSVHHGQSKLDQESVGSLIRSVNTADRPLIVVGPTDTPIRESIATLARSMNAPIFADPLSGLRFGRHIESTPVCGGYDTYLDERLTTNWPSPDLVLRFGAAPTSSRLQEYLSRIECHQFIIDPAGGWREPTFTATDLLIADPNWIARTVAEEITPDHSGTLRSHFAEIEKRCWTLLEEHSKSREASVITAVLDVISNPASMFISNSRPVRDLDRFGRPRTSPIDTYGNRGVSGIDGITSTALGIASAATQPLVLITGDIAFYHDMTGLLAIDRCNIDFTAIVINNDGGGIFHALPIAGHDTFEQFKTPHGLDFQPLGDLFDFDYRRVADISELKQAFDQAHTAGGTTVLEIRTDASSDQDRREQLRDHVVAALRE